MLSKVLTRTLASYPCNVLCSISLGFCYLSKRSRFSALTFCGFTLLRVQNENKAPSVRERSVRHTFRTFSKSAVPEGSQLDLFSSPTSSGSQKYHVTRKQKESTVLISQPYAGSRQLYHLAVVAEALLPGSPHLELVHPCFLVSIF